MSREATNRILEMVGEGLIDRDGLIIACFKYMSEDDVRDMAHANEIEWQDENVDDLEDEE